MFCEKQRRVRKYTFIIIFHTDLTFIYWIIFLKIISMCVCIYIYAAAAAAAAAAAK